MSESASPELSSMENSAEIPAEKHKTIEREQIPDDLKADKASGSEIPLKLKHLLPPDSFLDGNRSH
ncbi:hypothetical protein Pyn_03326 [Prunus yedoensis var. nudiflora]|uniref:Uncharacterized protein n=1 Tax=Prunus yedoensis var. nudiflora TaxID=2094558 RepID=A0A314Z2N0_PRUYE|nr:hypothetical protein Pyn_03326 [Prunus yedoensis var. nudiflora]